MTNSGPLSPDGRHQLVDGQWESIPKPPQSKVDRAHSAFSVFLVVLAVLIALAVIAAIAGF